jgi:hypothetical protein
MIREMLEHDLDAAGLSPGAHLMRPAEELRKELRSA